MAAPGDQIRIEFRYTDTAPAIPAEIVRTGLNYRLVEARDPVVEYQSPLIRETSQLVTGYIKEADLPRYQNLEGVKITPVDKTLLKEDDIMDTVYDLETNDVEDLPEALREYARAGVRFEVVEEDAWGLPTNYTAYIYFRGLIEDTSTVYYKVERTMIREEVYGYQNQNLVVAIYEEVGEVSEEENTPLEELGGNEVPRSSGDIADQNERNVRQLEELQDGEMPFARINDLEVPVVPFSFHDSWSIANVLLTITSIAFVLIYIFNREDREENEERQHEGIDIRFIGIILGGVAIGLFFLTQQIKGIAVIFDLWSIAFALIVVAQIVIYVLSKRRVVEVR